MVELAEKLNTSSLDAEPLVRRLLAVASWAIWLIGMASAGIYLWVAMSFPIPPVIVYREPPVVIATTILAVSFTNVGLILTLTRPHRAFAWIFAAGSLVTSLHVGTYAYLIYALHQGMPPLLRAPDTAAWISSWGSVPLVSLLAFSITLLFPSGRLLSRRWAIAMAGGALGTVTLALYFAYRPGPFPFFPGIANPYGIEGPATALMPVLYYGGVLLIAGAAIAGAASMVVRYRRGTAVERQQLKWVAYGSVVATGLASVFFATTNLTLPQSPASQLTLVGALLGTSLLPVTVAIACLRYHLYDIDVIINRTLAWAVLTAILGGLYAASVAFFQRFFTSLTGDSSDAAIVLTTLLLAGVFTPLRKTLEGAVDRRFKTSPAAASNKQGDREDAARPGGAMAVAASGTDGVSFTPDVEALIDRLTEAVRERVAEGATPRRRIRAAPPASARRTVPSPERATPPN